MLQKGMMKEIKEMNIRQIKATQVQYSSKMSDSWSRDSQATADPSLGKMTLLDFPIAITESGWFGNTNSLGTNKNKHKPKQNIVVP